MTINERFVLFLKRRKITQKDFCARSGYGEKNLSNFINGNVKSPRIDIVLAVVNHYPELNIHWLLKGSGEIWNPGFQDDEIGNSVQGTSNIEIVGQPVDYNLLNDLITTKDALIESLKQQITQLNRELGR